MINGDWGGGSLIATPFGGAAIVAGLLDLAHDDNRYLKFSATGNNDSGQVGCVRWQYKPNYSGGPGSTRVLYSASAVAGGGVNLLYVAHTSSGINLQVKDSTGAVLISLNLATWSPIAGTTYEFELNWDLTAGATRLFIGGVQLGATQTATGTRGATGIFSIGADTGGGGNSNAAFANLEIFSAVQHTANYAPGYTVLQFQYAADTITLPLFTYAGLVPLLAFTGFSASDTNAPHYTANGQWWNGLAWVASDGSYAQSNTAAVLGTNIGTLAAANTVSIQVVFTPTSAQQSVDSLLVSYNGQAYSLLGQPIEVGSGILTDALVAVSAVFDNPALTQIGFYLEVAGVKQYWNGSAWALSDETIAKSNDLATLNANLISLVLTFGKTVKLGVVLKSSDGLHTPSITSAEVDYNFRAPGPTDPATCTVWAQLYDLTGEEVASGATLTAELSESFEVGERVVGASKITVPFDATGYAAVLLTQSVTAGKTYAFTINWTDPSGKARTINFVDAVVPAQDAISLMDLTSPQ